MIRMTLEIEPVAKARARITRAGHAYTPHKTRQFENAVRTIARVQANGLEAMSGPVELRVKFILARPKRTKNVHPCVRPDLDNYVKAVKDALNGVLWRDDGQVVALCARKLYDVSGGVPRIEIEVSEVAV